VSLIEAKTQEHSSTSAKFMPELLPLARSKVSHPPGSNMLREFLWINLDPDDNWIDLSQLPPSPHTDGALFGSLIDYSTSLKTFFSATEAAKLFPSRRARRSSNRLLSRVIRLRRSLIALGH
jgi:hypothetical protein